MNAAPSYAQWRKWGDRIRLEVPGGTFDIFACVHGNAESPSMLFLHGFPTSSWDFAPVAMELMARFRCIGFDFLGFGASDKPARHRYDLIEQADIAERVVRHFGVRRAYVVAHDYGASVLQELLARQRDGTLGFTMSGATVLNGGIYPDLHRPVFAQRLLRSPFGGIASRLMTRRRMGAALAAVFAPAHRPSDAELNQHWEAIAANGGDRIGHRLIAYIDDRLRHRDRWVDALEHAEVPLQFAWGMRDPVSGAHVMSRLKTRLDGRAELRALEDAGHYPQLEACEAVAAAIQAHAERSV